MGFVSIDRRTRSINKRLHFILHSALRSPSCSRGLGCCWRNRTRAFRYCAVHCSMRTGWVHNPHLYRLSCIGFHADIKVLDVAIDEFIIGIVDKQIHIGLLARTQIVQTTDFVTYLRIASQRLEPMKLAPPVTRNKVSFGNFRCVYIYIELF